MASHRKIRFFKNKAMQIDLERRRVTLHNGLVESYDTLVIAVGSVTNYYGVPGAAEHTLCFKTIVDAMKLRARVVELFEMAEQAETPEQRRRLLSFAIVGGGVTGVEVAAELMDMARETLLPRYPGIERSALSVTILESGSRLVFRQGYGTQIDEESYGVYNFNWGYYLESLRSYCESGTGKPFQAP